MNSIIKNPELMKLQADIEQFIEARGMSRTGFGLWAVNDPNLLRDLEAGRDLRWSTMQFIRDKMAGPAL